jgi:hypothetical protein
MRRAFLLVLAGLALAACTVTGPVAIIAPNGEILRGASTSGIGGDEFVVRGQALECRGRFDPVLGDPAVAIAAHCSDGHVGAGFASRDNLQSGRGRIRLNDGSEATFLYGQAAWGI